MNKENFIKLINYYKEATENADKWYEFGIDLYENAHSAVVPLSMALDMLVYEVIGDVDKADTVFWFMFENDFGKNNYAIYQSDGEEVKITTASDLYDYLFK